MFLRNEHFLLSMGIPSNDSVQDVSDFKQRYFLLDARIESDVLLCSQLDDIFQGFLLLMIFLVMSENT